MYPGYNEAHTALLPWYPGYNEARTTCRVCEARQRGAYYLPGM